MPRVSRDCEGAAAGGRQEKSQPQRGKGSRHRGERGAIRETSQLTRDKKSSYFQRLPWFKVKCTQKKTPYPEALESLFWGATRA